MWEHAQGTKKGESGENIATDIAMGIGKIYYRMSHAGSTLYATDEKGEVLYHTEYDPWGNPQGKTKVNINFSGIENFNNFTGYTYDETLGIYYAQARFYNPQVKRFITEDPVKDGLNWYAYVGNNPVNSVDPLGLSAISMSEFNSDYAILFEAAKEYEREIHDTHIDKSKLLIGFFRKVRYSGGVWDVVSGKYEIGFNDFLQDSGNAQYQELNEKYQKSLTLIDNHRKQIDFPHLFATLGGQYNMIPGVSFASGLGGDLWTSIEGINNKYEQSDKSLSITEFYFQQIGHIDTRISEADIMADVDAENIYYLHNKYLNPNQGLHIRISEYYADKYSISSKYRFTAYYSINMGNGQNVGKVVRSRGPFNEEYLYNKLYNSMEVMWFQGKVLNILFNDTSTTADQRKTIARAMAKYIVREASSEVNR